MSDADLPRPLREAGTAGETPSQGWALTSPTAQLVQLLADVFTPGELRRFIDFGPEGEGLVQSLNFDGGRVDVAYQAVDLLRRHGGLGADFFERLRGERPWRVADIDAVARAWSGRRIEVAAETHVILLVAAIAGQVSAIDDGQIKAALGACQEVGRLRLDLHDLDSRESEPSIWSEGQARIQTRVQEYLRVNVLPSAVHHVSVFGLAPIPWLMALGYALSETVEARVYQRLRVPSTWNWQPHDPSFDRWRTRVISTAPNAREAAVFISASAEVQSDRVDAVLSPAERATYEISLIEPKFDGVRSLEQLEAFGQSYRALLVQIEREQPKVERVHVFAAAPVAVSVDCGRRILHNGDPVVVAYQFHARRYVRALELRP